MYTRIRSILICMYTYIYIYIYIYMIHMYSLPGHEKALPAGLLEPEGERDDVGLYFRITPHNITSAR